MPLYKSLTINENTKVFIWKIDESFNELNKNVLLSDKSQIRLDSMKSDLHQRGFLSVRHLLKEAGYSDTDLIYDEFGKPHLKDGKYISITHSFTFSGLIVSDDLHVGIDIEMQRDKILKIAHKFTHVKEYVTIANHDDLIRKLTIVWGGKESLYKIYGKKQLRFLENIYIEDFKFSDVKTTGEIRYKNRTTSYKIQFLEFDGFTCVYAY
ncbi:4'-phosphopantetheinyl transferase superfamily protein [Polaribacter sp. Z014]|uniref:4'-phosphopantetheinyl transferase family protein n=1 Tax=unclassified Polaribacter TaxID=196858 RepID=UPI00193BA7A2|nr:MULTISPECIES: 4'-phosphopantetheinyl transferase superfamily protein [unclassified Polaribacter]MCL7762340.1 4'-phosphopantetheinyl transferase superfamily protein [Polaribacter sp. Z014]QVY64237.1 4'-phosphopantetheinyl transferase superfamily protein [Polaribacter sp. Q13]